MEFRKMQYIIKIAECGNITRAAEESYLSQPALSHCLARIEKELGTPLFDRSSSPLKLTEAGVCYVRTAQRILELELEMRRDIQNIAYINAGRIRIGMSPERTAYMLPPVFTALARDYPGIKLETIERNVTDCEVAVLQGEADVAVVPFPLKNKGLKSELIYRESVSLLAPKGWLEPLGFHPGEVVSFAKIAQLPFIILKKGHRARTVFDEYCQMHNYQPNVVMETSSFDAVVRFVKSEIGVAVIPTFYVENVAQKAGVESFLFPMDSSKWDVGLVYSETRMLTAVEKELLRIFRLTFKDRA